MPEEYPCEIGKDGIDRYVLYTGPKNYYFHTSNFTELMCEITRRFNSREGRKHRYSLEVREDIHFKKGERSTLVRLVKIQNRAAAAQEISDVCKEKT